MFKICASANCSSDVVDQDPFQICAFANSSSGGANQEFLVGVPKVKRKNAKFSNKVHDTTFKKKSTQYKNLKIVG